MGSEVFSQLAVLDYAEVCELLELMWVVNNSHSGAGAFVFIAFDSLSERIDCISRPSEAASKAEKSEKWTEIWFDQQKGLEEIPG